MRSSNYILYADMSNRVMSILREEVGPGNLEQQTICTSRSFEGMVEDAGQLEMFISNYAAHCAQKLRAQKSVCSMVKVFIQTNHFREDLPQHDSGITVTLNTPANNTQEVVRAALRAFKACYKEGYLYKRAGVIVSGISKENAIQLNLFDELTEVK